MVKYIELRTRSAFSFLEGSALPEDLVERAAELGYPALAMGDRDGLYGAPRFYHGAERAGIRAIVGAELTLDLRLARRLPAMQAISGSTCWCRIASAIAISAG
jgi:DNA polymerase III alpha subunit